jgi:hypothetical protein
VNRYFSSSIMVLMSFLDISNGLDQYGAGGQMRSSGKGSDEWQLLNSEKRGVGMKLKVEVRSVASLHLVPNW